MEVIPKPGERRKDSIDQTKEEARRIKPKNEIGSSSSCLSNVRLPALTCSLVLEVVLDVVGLQAVHVRAFLWRAVVKVVVNHVVHDVATQPSDKHGHREDVWERVAEDRVEASHH